MKIEEHDSVKFLNLLIKEYLICTRREKISLNKELNNSLFKEYNEIYHDILPQMWIEDLRLNEKKLKDLFKAKFPEELERIGKLIINFIEEDIGRDQTNMLIEKVDLHVKES